MTSKSLGVLIALVVLGFPALVYAEGNPEFDALVEQFKEWVEETEEDDSVKISIVGKPNVGKSTLLNRLVGQERSIVSPIPGTTRDAVDTGLIFDDVPLTLILSHLD